MNEFLSNRSALAERLRQVCPDCLEKIAEVSGINLETLELFAWEDIPLSLDDATSMATALLLVRSNPTDWA